MRVLLDTNIVLDYLGANQGFTEDAEKVFDLATKRKDIKLVSSSAITDILEEMCEGICHSLQERYAHRPDI